MEKKTIGKFIAVLRKANGLTQADLAEKLFVSDKTVSRWERDESAPDLELIPVIADLFGVTTDEILRGERLTETTGAVAREDSAAETDEQRKKTEKRYKKLLDKRCLKFKNLSFISIGIVLLGIIAAAICLFSVDAEKVDENILAACIMMACLAMATLCQIVFTNLCYYREEEDEQQIEEIAKYKENFSAVAVRYFLILAAVLGATLPVFFIDRMHTDNFNTILPFVGLFLAVVFPLIGYFGFWLFKKLRKRTRKLSAEQIKNIRRLRRRVFLPTLGAVVVFLAAIAVVCYGTETYDFAKAVEFTKTEDFIAYMEQNTDVGDLEKEPYSGFSSQIRDEKGFFYNSVYGDWTYVGQTDEMFFWANKSVMGYSFSDDDGLLFKVYEKDAYEVGRKEKKAVVITDSCLAIVSVATGFVVYKIVAKKKGF